MLSIPHSVCQKTGKAYTGDARWLRASITIQKNSKKKKGKNSNSVSWYCQQVSAYITLNEYNIQRLYLAQLFTYMIREHIIKNHQICSRQNLVAGRPSVLT